MYEGKKEQLLIPDINRFTELASYYHPLLTRYARIIIRDNDASAHMAAKSLLLLWSNRSAIYTNECLRTFLQRNTRRNCDQWLRQQALFIKEMYQNLNYDSL
jgi:DNA-directed RNA polymerase specialized sigma24 family protein